MNANTDNENQSAPLTGWPDSPAGDACTETDGSPPCWPDRGSDLFQELQTCLDLLGELPRNLSQDPMVDAYQDGFRDGIDAATRAFAQFKEQIGAHEPAARRASRANPKVRDRYSNN